MSVLNYTRGVRLAGKVEVAETWLTRLRGLMFRAELASGNCMVISPCKAIHTCFMRFRIDVLFVSRTGKVVFMVENMAPLKFSPVVREASFVIELPAETIKSTGTSVDDLVGVVP